MRTAVAAFLAAVLGCLLEGKGSGGLVTMATAAVGTGLCAWWTGRHPVVDPQISGMTGGTAGVAAVLIIARLTGSIATGSMAVMLLMAGGMGAMLGEAVGRWGARPAFTGQRHKAGV